MIIEKIDNPLMKVVAATIQSRTERGESSFGSTGLASFFTEDVKSEFALSNEERPIHRLYAMDTTFNIEGCKEFTVKAILDTGATVSCINSLAISKESMEKLSYSVNFSGINSSQSTNTKLKNGMIRIAGQSFRIPFTYCLEMHLRDGINLLLGCNFIKAMGGGVRFEGNNVTFYKKITSFTVEGDVQKIVLCTDKTDDEFAGTFDADRGFKQRNEKLFQELKEMGYFGDDPLKYWAKNQVICKLDIINPDITIQDKPMKQVTLEMEKSFKAHIEQLLKLKVIRPSKSRHRTMAFMVKSGTAADPTTEKETKGKERLVFNYKSLNDNTWKDQYSLPSINLIVKKVSQSKIFSKFDLKSGFHQVAMHPDSIDWTAFIVPQGLYEWLVMPFGIKNAPAIFQRKMDNCFSKYEKFIAVYIDDILVFSQSEQEHAAHINKMLNICKENGLVLSPSKMKVAVSEINFLGVTLGNRKIKLQELFIKKIVNFDEVLQTVKGLRSFLGILNFARSYVPKLGLLLSPLYSKTSCYGDKKFKTADWKLIRQIKLLVQNLPDLELPPTDAYIIIETDGCMEGWGAVCKWKPKRFDPKPTEKICAYASGKFSPLKSAIDGEMHAAMEGLEAFKIHYLDKQEITLRTDCDAIIQFFNKTNQNKPSRVRWLGFIDFCTNTRVNVIFEHIDAKNNVIDDALSRLIYLLQEESWNPSPATQQCLQVISEVHQAPLKVQQLAQSRILSKLATKPILKHQGMAQCPPVMNKADSLMESCETNSPPWTMNCLSSSTSLKKRQPNVLNGLPAITTGETFIRPSANKLKSWNKLLGQ